MPTSPELATNRMPVALVTGASTGLGRHFAGVLASSGRHVVAVARRIDKLRQLEEEIAASGGACTAFELDVTKPEAFGATFDTIEAACGPVTILINNAGAPDAQRAHKIPIELADRVIDTNLRGPFLLACEMARRLIKTSTPGRIVNISSMTGFLYDGHGAALYSITKAALNRMTEVLAVEWARYYINVNAISPGAFESEMMDGMIERVGDVRRHFPRKRLGQPSSLDSTLLYLVSPESEFVTGTVIKVDDGQMPR